MQVQKNKIAIRGVDMTNTKKQTKQFEYTLQKKFRQLYFPHYHTELIFLCVGTDKIIGDAIGPIVGTKLEKGLQQNDTSDRGKNINIYGKIGNTLNFKNAYGLLSYMKKQYKNPFIITIDAALSENGKVGEIVVNEGKIELGNSLGRCIEWDSHINIKGVVGNYSNNPKENIETLKNVQVHSAMTMSQNIYQGIQKIICTIYE